MTRSEEAAAWFAAVYQAVQEIPCGKVTSYGHIAKLLGKPECPRQVGMCLKHLPDSNAVYNEANVPWQRVINSKGMISPRGIDGATRQAQALAAEGVEVQRDSFGGFHVDFDQYGWFPENLTSNF